MLRRIAKGRDDEHALAVIFVGIPVLDHRAIGLDVVLAEVRGGVERRMAGGTVIALFSEVSILKHCQELLSLTSL